jgi:hypothetical protein
MGATRAGSICAAIVATVAAWNVALESAQAQFSPWPQFRPFWAPYPSGRYKRHHRDADSGPREKATAHETAKGPLQLVVSIADQEISVYDDGELIARSPVSTGVTDHPTPLGVFSVISKQRWHRSNIYSDAPMPYMQRITWSGIALHAGVLPGHPASHGCIRMKTDFAIRLWHLTRRGARVIIAPNDVRPIEIANPHLPQSISKVADVAPRTAAVISDNAMSDVVGMPAMPTSADDPPQATSQPPRSSRKPAPVSVLVSRKSNKLFVRQGYTPLFETPVTIRDPEEPLGTHVFTLMRAHSGDGAFRWTVMSIPEGAPRTPQRANRRPKSASKQMMGAFPPEPSTENANAALDRIEMPPEAMERISELLIPGSSLIVSDHGISNETGSDTDFIVETR